jgi:hypothetical protein
VTSAADRGSPAEATVRLHLNAGSEVRIKPGETREDPDERLTRHDHMFILRLRCFPTSDLLGLQRRRAQACLAAGVGGSSPLVPTGELDALRGRRHPGR